MWFWEDDSSKFHKPSSSKPCRIGPAWRHQSQFSSVGFQDLMYFTDIIIIPVPTIYKHYCVKLYFRIYKCQTGKLCSAGRITIWIWLYDLFVEIFLMIRAATDLLRSLNIMPICDRQDGGMCTWDRQGWGLQIWCLWLFSEKMVAL